MIDAVSTGALYVNNDVRLVGGGWGLMMGFSIRGLLHDFLPVA